MSDSNDQTLKIRIIADADTAGFKSAAGAAKELESNMGVVNVSGEDVKKILGETDEKAELSGRSMRRLAHAMGSEIPGGAALMEAGFEAAAQPMMASVFLLVAGIEMLKNAIEKINQEREQAGKISEALADADAEHSKVIDKQREALDKAEIAEAEFHHNFVRNTQNAIDQAEKLAEAILKTAGAADGEMAGKRHGIAEKGIEDLEQRGVVSHAAALKMKEQLDIEYEQQKMLRLMAQDALEQKLIANQLATKQNSAYGLGKKESAAEAGYSTAAEAKAANDARIEEANKKISTGEQTIAALRATGVTEENVQKLRESYEATSGKPGQGKDAATLEEQFHYLSTHFGGIVPRKLFGTSGDINLATYEGANIDIAAGKSDLARARGKSTGLDITEGNAKSDLDAARREMEKNRDQVRELQDKLTEKAATDAIKESGAQSDLGMSKANAALISDRATADRVMAGGRGGGADEQKMIADASRIAGHTVDLKTAAQIIENGANNLGIFMNQLGRLAQVMASLNPGQMAQMKQQIDGMQRQITHGSLWAN